MNGSLNSLVAARMLQIGSNLTRFAGALEDGLVQYFHGMHARHNVRKHDASVLAVNALHRIWTDYRQGAQQTDNERELGRAIDACVEDAATDDLLAAPTKAAA